MKRIVQTFLILIMLSSCNSGAPVFYDNPQVSIYAPSDFPDLNDAFYANKPTKYGVELGKKLFFEKKLSADNTISCSSCHIPSYAFADSNKKAIGLKGRIGLRNTPPVQNLAFMKFYNWDGSKLQLENQPIVPIITHEEMDSSILEVIAKLQQDESYKVLFRRVFGDSNITPERIFKSISQYEYTLISANSKYDRVMRKQEIFTDTEARGFMVFKEKCADCHSTGLFTDQSFRNVGFPINFNSNEAGRARVTGVLSDYMSFRVPSLRNIMYTAPYGSFGQFPTLMSVLDYFDRGVLAADNLDSTLKKNGNKIPLSTQEKEDIISFLKTLNDEDFVKQ